MRGAALRSDSTKHRAAYTQAEPRFAPTPPTVAARLARTRRAGSLEALPPAREGNFGLMVRSRCRQAGCRANEHRLCPQTRQWRGGAAAALGCVLLAAAPAAAQTVDQVDEAIASQT